MSITETIFITLKSETCCNCGVVFGIESNHRQRLIETHASFYCPNGHSQHYTAKTEAEKLREELERTQQRESDQRRLKEQARAETEKVTRKLISTKGHITRIKNRVANGVCPCCNRTFKQLAQHMKAKHPEYKKESA